MTIEIILTLGAFIFVAACLISGKIPASVACGAAVLFLWLAGILTSEEVFANFVSNNSIVMVGMMIEIGALMKTNILINIANLVRKSKGSGYRVLLIAAMLIPYILCQFIGGVTALVAVIPLLIGLAKEIGVAPTKLVLPASVGAQCGLYALPIGGGISMYLLKNQMMANLGSTEELGFFDLAFTRIPGNIAIILFVIFIGYKLLPERELSNTDMIDQKSDVIKASVLPRWQQIAAYVIFFGSVIAMCLTKYIGLSNTQIAVIGAFLCVILGILDEREMYQSVSWSLVFLMAFMLSLTTAIGNSGAGDLVASAMRPVFESENAAIAVAIVFIVCILLTQIVDNMVVINMLAPIAIIACGKYGMSALPFIAAIDASGCSSFSTPLASTASLVTYKMGGYSMWEMVRFTAPLVLISTIVSIIWFPIYFGL